MATATQEQVDTRTGEIVTTQQGGGELAERQPGGGYTLKTILEAKRGAIAAVCSKNLSPDRLIKMAATALSRVPGLLECTPLSFATCVMQCAELGLTPGVLGEVYFIPFNNNKTRQTDCTMIVGYRGLLTLARRSGTLVSVAAEVVRKGDSFVYTLGFEPDVKHTPGDEQSVESITHVWAAATLRGGGRQLVVMRRAEVESIRQKSQGRNSPAWTGYWAEMAKKTALRRLCKLLPLSPETAQQIQKIDETEFDFDEVADGSFIDTSADRSPSAIADRIEKANGAGNHEPPPDDPAKVAEADARREEVRRVAEEAKAKVSGSENAQPPPGSLLGEQPTTVDRTRRRSA